MGKPNNYAKASMTIRKPIDLVFNAFIDPDITTNFWFSHSSGKLEQDSILNWRWDLHNFTIPIKVLKIEQNRLIVLEWGSGIYLSTLMWEFKELNSHVTYVTITNYNLQGKDDTLIDLVRDSSSGLAFVLAGLKAWLENGVRLNLSDDKYPKELTDFLNK